MEHSDWLVFGRDFTVRTITMETVPLDIFFSHSRKIQTAKTEEDKKGTKQMNEVNMSV